ncbi:hypothetical protein AVEN_145845-1 [Araneus ventricosus]|uniref:PiggyBac transposable element-derived protein domain-containing protein n=1 Tax=Araneus ventricosus TaxID=182803 RepID=A0A4Y2UT45_ARAVE|nr:hypothetical protein AVEN_145845-1 [Araneus ventricosus]
MCITSYNEYEKGADLFHNHTAAYFTSIQRREWYWLSFINAFETITVASWKLNQLFSDDSLSLLDFRRQITVAYSGIPILWNPSWRKLDVQQANQDLIKLKNEHVIVKNPENRQRRWELKPYSAKPTTICQKM